MKRTIRLTEGDLKRMIKESVRRVLREQSYDDEFRASLTPFTDDFGNQYYYDDRGWVWEDANGYIVPSGYKYDPETGEMYQADYEGNRQF